MKIAKNMENNTGMEIENLDMADIDIFLVDGKV